MADFSTGAPAIVLLLFGCDTPRAGRSEEGAGYVLPFAASGGSARQPTVMRPPLSPLSPKGSGRRCQPAAYQAIKASLLGAAGRRRARVTTA